ncbi:GntR family transcriptional regulator [Brevibacterium samyangense]|uniref:GntR family transcriptional regulator n=1 Tax=Brevibacterium samyangense TaxID=366888 RepID=A0ABN2TKN0_9MICO
MKHDRESIREILGQEIFTGVLEPGSPLREVVLAERFGVSRTPVREALTALEQNGLAVRRGRSLFVRSVDPATHLDVFDVWALLEVEAVAHAARNRRLDDLIALEHLLSRDRDSGLPDPRERILANLEFHRALWAAAHHPVLEDLLERTLLHHVHAPDTSVLTDDARWAEALEEHARILAAVSAQDVDSAREFTREHFQASKDERVSRLRAARRA